MSRFATPVTITSLNSWLRQRKYQLFRSAAGQKKPSRARSRRRPEVECLESRLLPSSVLGIPTDSQGNPVWPNPLPPVSILNTVTNPNWASDLAGGLSGRLKTGLNPDINPANIERALAIAAGLEDAGSPGTFVEWRPVLAANGGITDMQSNLHGGLDQYDNNLVAISGTAIHPEESEDDVHVSHPFGSDAEFYVLPDNRQYLPLFAPTNFASAGGVAFAQDDVPGVQDTHYAAAIQEAQEYSSATIAAFPNGATETGNTVTITTTAPHHFSVGDLVKIGGVGVAGYNGAFTIASVPTPTTFTYTDQTAGLANSGSVTIAGFPNGATEAGNTVTITTTAAHNLSVGDLVEIAGVGVAGYNGAFTVTSIPTPTTFTYTDQTAGLANSGGGTPTNAALGVPGVLGVETDQGLLPDFSTALGYGPQATGDSVAVWGRWIVDAGHPDFHTEIHPPLLVASAHPLPGLGETDSTVVGRPYLVDQLGYQTDDGVQHDGGVFDHVGNEVRKVLGNGNFLGIPSSTTLEAHPNLLPTFAPGDTQVKVMDYVVQAPIPSPGADYRLIANMSFTVRTGITVSVTKLPGQEAVAVHVTMDPTQYKQAPPPASKTTYYDDQLVGGVGEGVLAGLGDLLLSPVTNPLFGFPAAINGTQAITRGISTDKYTLSPPPAPLFQVAVDALQGNPNAYAKMNNDDDQPFPVIGKLQLFWTNKPTILDEYKALGGNSSFLGLPLDGNGNPVQQSDPIIFPSGSVEFADFERGRIYYTLETGTVAIGATGSVADGQGGTILAGTMIVRGSPVDDAIVVKSVAVHDFYTDRETGIRLFDIDDHFLRVDDTFPQFPQFDFVMTFRSVQDDPKFGDSSDAPADAADLFTGIDFASFSTFSGDQGNDSFTNQTRVHSTVTAGNGADSFVDQSGHGSLSGPASSTTWQITGVNSGSYAGAGASGSFTGFENLSGGSAADTFQFSGQGTVTSIAGGGGAGNTLDYSNYPGPVNYSLRTRIIPTGTGFTVITIFVTTGVTNPVTDFQTVIGSPFGQNTIGGAQQAVFPVTAATLPPPGTAIDGSGNAHATLVGDNTANKWTISGQGSGNVNGTLFKGFDQFEGGSSTDSFLLQGAWQAGGPGVTQIHAHDGDDILTVDLSKGNPLAPAGLLFDGGRGNNKLIFQGGSAVSMSYTATGSGSGAVVGTFDLGPRTVTYGGVSAIVDQLSASSRSFVDAALGVQQIRLADDQASQGSLSVIDSNGTGTFAQIAFAAPTGQLSIQGRDDDTTIKIDKRDRPYNLFVDGAGGVNTLDYTDFPTAVAVNLPAGTATGTSGIKNIQNVTGSHFDDTIVGLPNSMLNGNGGNDNMSGAGVAFFQLNPALPPPKPIDGSGNIRSVVGVLGGLNNSWIVSGLGSGTVNSIPFSGMTDLAGGSGGNAFQIAAGAGITGVISGGGGTNTLDYSRLAIGATVNLANGAATATGAINNIQSIVASRFASQITSGGTATHTFFLSPNAAAGTVITGNGNDTLVGASTTNIWTITDNSAVGGVSGTVNGVSFSGIGHIIGGNLGQDTLVGPNTPRTWNITGAGSGSLGALGFSQIQNLIGGSADDQFVATANGSVTGTIDGGGGNNSLSATEAAGNVTNWTITGAGSGRVGQRLAFADMHDLVGQGGVDNFQFSAGGSIAGTVVGGSSSGDILSYANETGPVTVNLQTSAAPQIAGGAAGGFSGITSFQGSTSTANTLVGPNGNTTWTVSAANGGSGIASSLAFSFSGFQNLAGGAGGDVFRFTRTGSLSGSLDGGGAPRQVGNWLDYSGLTTAVTVNLQTGAASSVASGAAGAVMNIQAVHGGSGGNTLTGDSHGNILIGGSATDRITGGSGVSLLIGDLGADAITGGSGGDILIGDATAFDLMTAANEAALMATLAEWQSADSYATRFALINTGASGGLLGRAFTGGRLNFGTTVGDDSAADTVTAAASPAALDWFFIGTADVLRNFEPGEDINNNNNTPAKFADRAVTSPIPEGGLATVSGTITDPDASDSLRLTANWGDGTPAETYTFPPGSGGQRVSVSHRYRQEGNYTIALSWTDPIGPANQATLTVAVQAVADAPLSGNSVGISVPRGTVASNVVVATFTDIGGAEASSDYAVLINWGDGSAPTPGIVTGSTVGFTVTGTHTYAAPGHFIAHVTIQDDGAQSITVNSPAVIGSVSERFVAQVYLDLLGRFVDAAGLATFTGLLAQGVSAAQLVSFIESSHECHLVEVQAAYQLLLHRAADAIGWHDDVGLLDSGATIEQVEAIIAGSPEYFSIRGGGTNDGFLTAIYGDLLHRAPDNDSRAAFDQLLQTRTTAQAAAIVLGSLEYKRDLVESYYENFLHRAGDANGMAKFTALLNSGVRDEVVIANILGSAEYMENL
jgi:hypothetical protein